MDIDICLPAHLSSTETASLCLLAERYGIRGVWNTCGIDGRDPFTNLAEAARVTTKIRLGPMAISPYEMHPFRLVVNLLTLNEIADGRAMLALGAGADVLKQAGLVAERPVTHVREALEIVRGAARSRPFTFHGEVFTLEGFNPSWIDARAPEVVACAMRPQMIRAAVPRSDGLLFSDFTPRLVSESVASAKSADVTRGIPINSFQPLFLYSDEGEAREHARSTIAWRALWRRYITEEFLDEGQHAVLVAHMPALYAMAESGQSNVDGVPDEILDACVDHLTLVGTERDHDAIVVRLREFGKAGLDRVALGIERHIDETIRVLGEKVIPALRGY